MSGGANFLPITKRGKRAFPSALPKRRSGAALAKRMRSLYRGTTRDRLTRVEEHREIGVLWLEALDYAIPTSGLSAEDWARRHLPFGAKFAARCAQLIPRMELFREAWRWWKAEGEAAGWRQRHGTGVDWALELIRDHGASMKGLAPDNRDPKPREPEPRGEDDPEELRRELDAAEERAADAERQATTLARRATEQHEWEQDMLRRFADMQRRAEAAEARAERYRQRLLQLGQSVGDDGETVAAPDAER